MEEKFTLVGGGKRMKQDNGGIQVTRRLAGTDLIQSTII